MDELLLRRLEELERDKSDRLFADQKKGFFDKYGTMFGGDEGIGTAILAQFNRFGIDTSAADKAVQEIVNGIRQQAIEILDKLGAVEQAIDAAQQGGMSGPLPPPDMAPLPDAPPSMEEPPMEELPPPPEGDIGGAPPPMEEPPPPPPEEIPSDKNLKTVSDVDLKDKMEVKSDKKPDEAEEEVFDDEGLGDDEDLDMEGFELEDDEFEDDELVPFDIGQMSQIWTDELPELALDADESDFIANLLLRGR